MTTKEYNYKSSAYNEPVENFSALQARFLCPDDAHLKNAPPIKSANKKTIGK